MYPMMVYSTSLNIYYWIHPKTVIVGAFDTPLSPIERSSKKNSARKFRIE
jgi:hypothetical protein